MQSVTSNAVYNALEQKAPKCWGVYTLNLTPRQLNTDSTFCDIIKNIYDNGYKIICFSVGWEEYQSFSYAGCGGIIIFNYSSARGFGQMWDYNTTKVKYGCCWTDTITLARYKKWEQI